MNITVLGGNGFIGTHVVDMLLEAGHNVTIFSRSPEHFRSPRNNVNYILAGFEDDEKLSQALKNTDIVIHLITSTIPETSNENPVYDIQSNLINTVKLLNQCVALGVQKVVYLSSGGTIYGIPKSYPIDEYHDTNPICSYGIVKLAVEKYLHLYHYLYGLNFVILRASNPYGEGQDPSKRQGVISVFMGKALSNSPVTLWGDGNVVRDYIYVKDLARACVLAAEHKKIANAVLNISSSQGTSLSQILSIIHEVAGIDIKVDRQPPRRLDVPKIILSNKKALVDLGWSPKTPLKEGILHSWEWLKQHTNAQQNPVIKP